LLFGLSFVVFIVRRWRRPTPVAAGVPAKPLDAQLLAALEEEMKASGLEAKD
jgi:hypothetical protein